MTPHCSLCSLAFTLLFNLGSINDDHYYFCLFAYLIVNHGSTVHSSYIEDSMCDDRFCVNSAPIILSLTDMQLLLMAGTFPIVSCVQVSEALSTCKTHYFCKFLI